MYCLKGLVTNYKKKFCSAEFFNFLSKCSYGVTVLKNAIKNWGPHASFQNMPRPILGRLVPKIYGNVWRTTKKLQYFGTRVQYHRGTTAPFCARAPFCASPNFERYKGYIKKKWSK